jgi:hypothetical protein
MAGRNPIQRDGRAAALRGAAGVACRLCYGREGASGEKAPGLPGKEG